ncbi:heme exporter protein CcmD [Alphaproteobacteria bacterium]|nr:heme exporter protein CcmD [Alphaproteobacteria bacterium]
MAEFFNMGGFGTYIWTSYGFAVICLGWLNYTSWCKAKNTAKQLAILQAATPSSPKSAG